MRLLGSYGMIGPQSNGEIISVACVAGGCCCCCCGGGGGGGSGGGGWKGRLLPKFIVCVELEELLALCLGGFSFSSFSFFFIKQRFITMAFFEMFLPYALEASSAALNCSFVLGSPAIVLKSALLVRVLIPVHSTVCADSSSTCLN